MLAVCASLMACDQVLGLDDLRPPDDSGVDGSVGRDSSGSGSGSSSGGQSSGSSGSSGGSSGSSSGSSGSSSGAEAGPESGVSDSGPDGDATSESSVEDAAVNGEGGSTNDAGDAGCVPLKVKYVQGCEVTVGGSAPFTTAKTLCVAPGAVELSASPSSAAYELGAAPWHGTTGDKGSGDPGSLDGGAAFTTVVAVAGPSDTCVWACCPLAPGGNGCPTSDQCP